MACSSSFAAANALADARRRLVAVRIRRRDVREARDARLEERPVRGDAGGAHRRQRHAVIAVDARDHPGLAGTPAHLPIGARQLDAALRRLAAAAGEEEVVDRGVAQRRQPLGQLDGARIGVAAVAGAVGQRARLVVHCVRQLAAAVSRRDVPQPGQPVDAFPAVGVRQDRAVALYPDASARVERRLVQRMDQVRLVAREQFSVREIRYGHKPGTILAARDGGPAACLASCVGASCYIAALIRARPSPGGRA